MAFKHGGGGLDDDLYSGFDTGGFSRDPNSQSSHLSLPPRGGALGSLATRRPRTPRSAPWEH